MPYKLVKRLVIASFVLIIAACGSRETVKTYTVYSTPTFCDHLTIAGLGFCTNFTNSEKFIEYGGSFAFSYRNIVGFSPDWGTQYEVTVLEGHDDEKLPSYKELLDYKVTSLDPIGTTYTFSGTEEGKAVISRSALTGYSFLGYDVICDELICNSHNGSIDSATFELVKQDEKRMIEIVELNYQSSNT